MSHFAPLYFPWKRAEYAQQQAASQWVLLEDTSAEDAEGQSFPNDPAALCSLPEPKCKYTDDGNTRLPWSLGWDDPSRVPASELLCLSDSLSLTVCVVCVCQCTIHTVLPHVKYPQVTPIRSHFFLNEWVQAESWRATPSFLQKCQSYSVCLWDFGWRKLYKITLFTGQKKKVEERFPLGLCWSVHPFCLI